MALLLELACPFALSRAQFAAVVRWLARWREQAKILVEADTGPKSCGVPLDLSLDQPFSDNLRPARLARWLSVGPVLRKIGQRLESLAAGESPENLKLGSALSADACTDLLTELAEHLKEPPQRLVIPEETTAIEVACGLENLYRVIGGTGLRDASSRASSFGNQLSQEQLAVFGHVVRHEEKSGQSETWGIVQSVRDEFHLFRPVGSGEARLALRSLIALRPEVSAPFALAVVSSLSVCVDGGLCIVARVLASEPQPFLMEIRDKTSGASSRHPALMLPAGNGGVVASMFVPVGLTARAAASRFLEPQSNSALSIHLANCIERGSDHERWAVAHGES